MSLHWLPLSLPEVMVKRQGPVIIAMLQEKISKVVLRCMITMIPIIILLYLLKLRRTPVVISSTLLWLKSLQDLTANAPFQRLRKNLLLLLQIVILICIVVALARPYVRAQGAAGRNICILLDRSASMQVVEGGGTRMDLAKEAALGIVDEIERGDKVMLVTFAETSNVLAELTDDRARIRAAIEGVIPSDTRTRLKDAMFVAYSLKQTTPDLHIAVVSDGNISDLADLGTRSGQRGDVFNVQRRELPIYALGKLILGQKVAKRIGRGGEAARYADVLGAQLADHLAQ